MRPFFLVTAAANIIQRGCVAHVSSIALFGNAIQADAGYGADEFRMYGNCDK